MVATSWLRREMIPHSTNVYADRGCGSGRLTHQSFLCCLSALPQPGIVLHHSHRDAVAVVDRGYGVG